MFVLFDLLLCSPMHSVLQVYALLQLRFGFCRMNLTSIWQGRSNLVDLLELPRESRWIEERTQVKACEASMSTSLMAILLRLGLRLSSGLYCSCTFSWNERLKRQWRGVCLTAWYEGVRVVILCLLRAYSKKKCFTFSAT